MAQTSTTLLDAAEAEASPDSVAVDFDGNYQSFKLLPGFDGPAPSQSSTSSTSSSRCPGGNGTSYTSKANGKYQVICDIDFLHRDLPFQLVGTFDDCVSACDDYNKRAGSIQCVAALFVAGRVTNNADDCYLKYRTDNPTPATSVDVVSLDPEFLP